MMSNSSNHPKVTLWLWPTGLFPRRIIFYFLAKHLTLPTLTSYNIHLIPITLTLPATLASLPGYEARPPNTSLPILRIQYADGREFWIRESLAIIEWFEEIFPAKDGWVDIWGKSIEQRTRVRDIMSLLSDASLWSTVQSIHSDPHTLSWSGLSEQQMSASAGEHARQKTKALLEKLVGWVQEGEEDGVKSLAGKGGVTIADVVLMAHVEYLREVYGTEWIGGHAVLESWREGMRGEKWVVGRERLKGVEEGGEWVNFLV